MSRPGFISRADLLKTLSALEGEERAAAAGLLGYALQPRAESEPLPSFVTVAEPQAAEEPVISAPAGVQAPLLRTPFWRPERFAVDVNEPGAAAALPVTLPVWRNRPRQPPRFFWIESWRSLAPRLLAALQVQGAHGLDCDIDRAVDILARGESLIQLPRKERPKQFPRIQIVFDRSSHLIPYWFDQDLLAAMLAKVFGTQNIETAFARETADELISGDAGAQVLCRLPPAGSAVLVLGDLGCLSSQPAHRKYREASWARFGRRARAEGCHTLALVPAPAGLVAASCRRAWRVLTWGQMRGEASLNRDVRRKNARRLLALVSHAFRIEPGLLRAARLLLGADVGAEAEAWGELEHQHPSAGTMAPVLADELRREFALQRQPGADDGDAMPEPIPPQTWKEYLASQAEWRHGVAAEIWFDEVINMPRGLQALLPCPEDAALSRQFFAAAAALCASGSKDGQRMASWLTDTVEPRATGNARAVPEFDRAIRSAAAPAGERHIVSLIQEGDEIVAVSPGSQEANRPYRAGSFLANISTRNDVFTVAAAQFWKSGAPPSWAADYGADEYGQWADIAVTGADGVPVSQRMRWIAPGEFLMGSSEDEPGRYAADEFEGRYNEGPQHQVRLSVGYWLFDTPVTQALWVAVVGNNPSRFQDPKRPVEQMNWDEAVRFLERINERVPGLDLVLPTEAQWEYACRAGTDTATYAGPIEILGERNAPVLDAIAWYGGNSGVGFDLDNGSDSSRWSEKQYEHNRAGSHPVGLKRPNRWGLHDMLGNVWEWCADDLRKYAAEAVSDPAGPLDGAERALRGGSWYALARVVRAAFRDADHREYRYDSVGFRCARVRPGAEPAEPGPGRAEREPAPDRRGGAELLSPGGGAGKTRVELPKGRAFTVRSDCEVLTFAPVTRPDWASAMGRDRYGLWLEFAIGEVRQRMRWIGPGRFLMGSPEGEEGRWGASAGHPEWNEGPQHEVRLTQGFWLFDTPVTQALWTAVMEKNPSKFEGALRPVEHVSWDDAAQFLERINGRFRGLDLVLPTEAQWEYACRAGTVTPNYAGGAGDLADIAWFEGNSDRQTHSVAEKSRNAWGLYDMLGNVWEWCADGLREYGDEAVTDPAGPLGGTGRALRGGSWFSSARNVRAAIRYADHREYRRYFIGFRCARVRP